MHPTQKSIDLKYTQSRNDNYMMEQHPFFTLSSPSLALCKLMLFLVDWPLFTNSLAIIVNDLSTLSAVFALVSMILAPTFCANCCACMLSTCRLCCKSFLFPIINLVMDVPVTLCTSFSQSWTCANVSSLVLS